MMVYSNQANKTLVQSGSKTLPKFIHSVNADPAKQTVTQQEERLFKSWQISLASILSNKTADWEQLVQLLGYRLQQDYKNLFGAHLAYLCANSLPSDPRERVIPLPTLNTDSLTGELDFAKLRDFPLLGSSFADKLARVMADCVSIMSLRMTEVLEYSLEKALNSSSDPAAANNSGISDSKSGGASGFFGWIGGASGKTSDKRQVEELSKDKKELADKLLRLRVILCPFKVRFALQLADYGLNSAAATYIQQSLSLVKEVASLDDPKNANRRPSVPILPFAKKFIEALEDIADRFGVKSKGYNVTVTGSALPSNSIPSQSSEDIKSSSSGWGISSVLSAANLKDFVDGPQQPPNGSAPRPNGIGGDNARTARGPPPQISHSPYPQGNTAPPQTLNHNPFPQGAGVAPAPHTRQTFNNTSSPAYPGGTNSNRGGPPLNSPGAYAAQSAPHLAASNNPPPTANFPAVAPASNSSVNSSGFVEVTLEDTGVNASYATAATPPSHIYSYPGPVTQAAANTNSSNTSAVSAPSNRASGRGRPHHHPAGVQQTFPSNKVVSSPWAMNAVSTGMQPQENANNSSSNTPPVSYHPSNPGQQSNNSNNNNNNNNSHFPTLAPASGPPSSSSQISNPAGDNNAPSKAERPQSGPKGLPPSPNSGSNLISVPTTGLVSTFRKGIINWFYPDAHDATENIGKSLEAYFDEKLNRWVFPGEDNPVADAALKPPPTGPLGGQPAAAIPSNDVQRLPDTAALNGGASSIAVAAAGGGYDPLAALMAPPTRAVRPPTSTSSVSSSSSIPADDPIAQMMMPPRFSSSLNNSNIPSANSTPPTSSAGAPPPSSQSVPTPATTGSGPPSKFNVWKPKPTENLAYASNPDMNQLMNQYQSQLPPVTSNNPGIAAISTTTADPDPGNADTAGSAGNPAAALTEIPLDGNNASQGPPPTFPTVSSSSSSYILPYAVNQSNVAYSYNDDAYNNFG